MEPMRPLMGREWEEKMGVSSLSWVAITDVLNVLVIEFTAEAFVHEVMDGIRNREGAIMGVTWSGARQMLNNLEEVFFEDYRNLGELHRIARAFDDAVHDSLEAQVEDWRDA
jgi:hypothetical protein